METETCGICGCELNRSGNYATPTAEGRSHATAHHYVAERFFGRSSNRRGSQRTPIFETCPWGVEGEKAVFCYECHEELMHNPVFLPDDVIQFAELVKRRGLAEPTKSESRDKLAGRIELLHDVIARGIRDLQGES
jgi:hypothetical protein